MVHVPQRQSQKKRKGNPGKKCFGGGGSQKKNFQKTQTIGWWVPKKNANDREWGKKTPKGRGAGLDQKKKRSKSHVTAGPPIKLHKFFEPNPPDLRKVRLGTKRKNRKEKKKRRKKKGVQPDHLTTPTPDCQSGGGKKKRTKKLTPCHRKKGHMAGPGFFLGKGMKRNQNHDKGGGAGNPAQPKGPFPATQKHKAK